MEVKVGIQNSMRELTVDSGLTQDEVVAAVATAMKGDAGVLTLDDVKGRRLIIPADKVSYVEIGVSEQRRVGFGTAQPAAD